MGQNDSGGNWTREGLLSKILPEGLVTKKTQHNIDVSRTAVAAYGLTVAVRLIFFLNPKLLQKNKIETSKGNKIRTVLWVFLCVRGREHISSLSRLCSCWQAPFI